MSETEAELSIIKNSRSFSMAAKFFPEEHWMGACHLYHWCRHCDDVTDNNHGTTEFNQLIRETDEVWHGSPKSPPFQSLQKVVTTFNIPSLYPGEMLQGMKMDRDKKTYQSFEELKLYCYRVASTVGLMMCHVMGIFHKKALKNAAYLGMAMQMTNIARDVKEDHENQRLYLPEVLLNKENLTRENYFLPQNRDSLFKVVARLIRRSEFYYRKGLQGITFLPLRSAFVVMVAAKLYREIGRQILKEGPSALEKRTIVNNFRKKIIILESLLLMTFYLPKWIFRRRKITNLDSTWSLS